MVNRAVSGVRNARFLGESRLRLLLSRQGRIERRLGKSSCSWLLWKLGIADCALRNRLFEVQVNVAVELVLVKGYLRLSSPICYSDWLVLRAISVIKRPIQGFRQPA